MKKVIYLLILAISFGCETEITPELNTAEEIIVVDAWITQKPERQEIRITRSQPYFDNSGPVKISGATVTIEDLDNGVVYQFQEGEEAYFWESADKPFGVTGHHYRLMVSVEGETFEAFSRLGRVPPVDAVNFIYRPKDFMQKQDYYTAEFMASDPAGQGDTYWIKAWRNGVFLGKPEELNMAYDAGFSAGQPVDGQAFIIPIRREFINPFDENPEKEGETLPPYLPGDSLYVEIHSLDPKAFDFLYGVYLNISRPGGFAELFALPLVNSATNLKSTNENSVVKVAGFFNVAGVSGAGKRLTQEVADQARQNRE
jgi:hypothetical protein